LRGEEISAAAFGLERLRSPSLGDGARAPQAGPTAREVVMKRVLIALCILSAALLVACGEDAKVNDFISKLDNLTTQVVQRVDKGPTPKAGIAAGLDYLDKNKADVEKSYHSIEKLRGYQVKKETMKKLTDSVTKDTSKIMGLKIKYAMQSVSDPGLSQKLNKLTTDYTSMLGM
jgi:hypothetical protein